MSISLYYLDCYVFVLVCLIILVKHLSHCLLSVFLAHVVGPVWAVLELIRASFICIYQTQKVNIIFVTFRAVNDATSFEVLYLITSV